MCVCVCINSSIQNDIIIFPAHEAYVMRTHNSDLGRRSPGGGIDRCKEYVPIKKDTLGQVVTQFTIIC